MQYEWWDKSSSEDRDLCNSISQNTYKQDRYESIFALSGLLAFSCSVLLYPGKIWSDSIKAK